jgi:delta1-piperideine-2-carboxylate reductase
MQRELWLDIRKQFRPERGIRLGFSAPILTRWKQTVLATFEWQNAVVRRLAVACYRCGYKACSMPARRHASGDATTDPESALAGAMLSFGGHKGSAIGTMVELLAGIMIGDLTGPEALAHLGATSPLPP